MSEYSHETVATQLIEVKGNRLAYRRIGKRGGLAIRDIFRPGKTGIVLLNNPK